MKLQGHAGTTDLLSNRTRTSKAASLPYAAPVPLALFLISLLLMLSSCGSSTPSAQEEQQESSGIARVANPIEEFKTAEEINERLGINLALPESLLVTHYMIIDNSLGSITFSQDNRVYTYRGMATSTEEDISGLYYDFTSRETEDIEGQACVLEYNDGGPGLCRWYDEAAGVTYSVSADTNTRSDTLKAVAALLINAQKR